MVLQPATGASDTERCSRHIDAITDDLRTPVGAHHIRDAPDVAGDSQRNGLLPRPRPQPLCEHPAMVSAMIALMAETRAT
jgi:hypothetical protein